MVVRITTLSLPGKAGFYSADVGLISVIYVFQGSTTQCLVGGLPLALGAYQRDADGDTGIQFPATACPDTPVHVAADYLGHRAIPARQPAIDVLSHEGFVIMLQQILIGVIMGFILQMVFGALVFGGQVVAYSMGLGFASMVDPQNGVQVPVLAQYYLILRHSCFLYSMAIC